MPRIYVRTLSQLDWLNQEETLLTIPGSYWLCHKKNIYKFIFRYHRTVKNTMQFLYGRELLKIVRRIIKCHPNQGQQFGTPHLLVTYNCTSWTRQDKMFAILKFQQRTNAATFSHAFVLTIRIYPSSEHSLSNLNYPIVKEADTGTEFKDLNVPLNTEEKITRTAICTDKVSSRKVAISHNKEDQISKYNENTLNKTSETKVSNLQDNMKNLEDFESLNATIKNATATDEVHFINKEFQDNLNENKSTNCNIKECERNMDQHPIDHVQEQSIIETKKMDKIAVTKIDDINQETKSIARKKSTQEIQNIRKYKIFSSLKSSLTGINRIKDDVDKWTLSSGFGFYENSTEKNICSLNDKDHFDDNGKAISETIVNPDNLPDQYNKSCKARKQKSRESERKIVSEDKILRSSNITDLVMEGLMFTIRQDQDSVAVIEQKTKLEIDEVLENSEKVETKAGEKCLLNSSLLRLENLVTMIDSPHKDQQHKTTCHSICDNMCLSPLNIFPSDTVHNLDVNNIDKLNIPTSYDKHRADIKPLYPCARWTRKRISSSIDNSDCSAKKMMPEGSEQLMKQQDNDNKRDRKDGDDIEMEREKRKDVLKVFPVLFSKEENAGSQNIQDTKKDLLMNNTDVEETSRHEMPAKKFYNSNNTLSCSLSSPKKIFTKKESSTISEESVLTKTNGPKIVSDKAVTIEQMPLALQKVLHKTHKLSSMSNRETLQYEGKMHDTTLTEKATSEATISYVDNNINSNITNNSSIEFTFDSKEIKNYNDESCETIDKDAQEINKDICMRNTKEQINESHCTSQRSSSSKNGSPRKLQDITEDFYYDLLHSHKDNAIRQRCLRQRQRSLNNPNNIKNGKMRIEMLKFIHDITEGARVVVRRLNIDNKSNLLEKNTTLATCTH
ncbi:uncharacterized protein LOC114940454 [Nylanderia fulva]|uniref:uncharacterized protein LOC114940454 n=1 Tax=Nylanderia fulva TaxID=613905 RepID=UPI0010FB4237|nr:uncharacterized protein LOC114940454 [Nylanderia fulva]XP_029170988.1 uncharacterized protein LOC114940454 [Nylanderia fulva]XP_029170989.1 uncharacterized protein LOC114940454 [Nylanderia fulva]